MKKLTKVLRWYLVCAMMFGCWATMACSEEDENEVIEAFVVAAATQPTEPPPDTCWCHQGVFVGQIELYCKAWSRFQYQTDTTNVCGGQTGQIRLAVPPPQQGLVAWLLEPGQRLTGEYYVSQSFNSEYSQGATVQMSIPYVGGDINGPPMTSFLSTISLPQINVGEILDTGARVVAGLTTSSLSLYGIRAIEASLGPNSILLPAGSVILAALRGVTFIGVLYAIVSLVRAISYSAPPPAPRGDLFSACHVGRKET